MSTDPKVIVYIYFFLKGLRNMQFVNKLIF